jgi:hypothetical protein
VLVVDRISKEVKKRLEFSCQLGHGRNIGWTRGIEVVGLKAYVGITKARHSKFKEYTKWMLPNRRGSMPSSILEIDLRTHKVTGAYEITGFHGCAIYSIIKVD